MEIPTNLRVYVCIHVFDMIRPVLLVANEDGEWMFLCGSDHVDRADNFRVVGAGHLIARDPSLAECLDLTPGYEAERKSNEHEWIRRQFQR